MTARITPLRSPAPARPGRAERVLRAGPDAALPAGDDDAAAMARHDRLALSLARQIYASRRRRARYMNADLFGEPTWDVLLDLYVAACEERRVPTTSACIGAHVPATTALRWLRIMEMRGLVEREDDGKDGRRTFVRLSRRGYEVMTALLGSLADGLLDALTAAEREPPPAEPA